MMAALVVYCSASVPFGTFPPPAPPRSRVRTRSPDVRTHPLVF